MSLGSRIRERLSELGMSQAELARRVGVRQSTMNSLIKGDSRTSRSIVQIARELRTTPDFLMGATSEPSGPEDDSPFPAPTAENDDDVEIDMIDLAFGMGQSFIDSDHVEIERVRFSRSWLRQFTSSPPEMLASTRGIGDSMMPTIHDRDVVIIDKSQKHLEGNMGEKIWAIVFGGMGMIKRIRQLPDGTVRISSDNQLIRDEIATDGDLFIVGRVVAKVSSL